MNNADLTTLFLSHARELRAFLSRTLRDEQLAEDLTQETFLRYAQQRDKATALDVTHRRAYLYRTAHNLAIDHMRREQRYGAVPDSEQRVWQLEDQAPSLEDSTSQRQQLDKVRAVIETLPAKSQRIFKLTRLDGLTYKQAAKELGISESSVQKHLSLSLQVVMQALK